MYVLFDYSCRQRLNNEDFEVNETDCVFFEDDVRFNIIKIFDKEVHYN